MSWLFSKITRLIAKIYDKNTVLLVKLVLYSSFLRVNSWLILTDKIIFLEN